MASGFTQSGVARYDVRRLQRAKGIKYTTALRELEAIDPENVRAYIRKIEQDRTPESNEEIHE